MGCPSRLAWGGPMDSATTARSACALGGCSTRVACPVRSRQATSATSRYTAASSRSTASSDIGPTVHLKRVMHVTCVAPEQDPAVGLRHGTAYGARRSRCRAPACGWLVTSRSLKSGRTPGVNVNHKPMFEKWADLVKLLRELKTGLGLCHRRRRLPVNVSELVGGVGRSGMGTSRPGGGW
jgi:hypothetical protein